VRTFCCSTTRDGCSTPTLSFILADTEQRARDLVRRELMLAPSGGSVEISEGGRVLAVETSEPEQAHSHRPLRLARLVARLRRRPLT
jgi:hypothetical protein